MLPLPGDKLPIAGVLGWNASVTIGSPLYGRAGGSVQFGDELVTGSRPKVE